MQNDKLNKKLIVGIVVCLVCLLLTLVLILQPATLSWVASAVRSSTFSVKSSTVQKMEAEMWINVETKYNEWVPGWYVDEIEASTDTTKKFASIGTFGKNASNVATFTPASPISLYFGTVNNLVQEQENQPVYLKFKINLKPQTDNTVILTYKNDEEAVGGQYLSIYKMDLTKMDTSTGLYEGVQVTNEEDLTALNNISDYPFLRFHYFISTTNYTLSNASENLENVSAEFADGSSSTVNFESLFDAETNTSVVEYTQDDEASHKIEYNNLSGSSSDLYIYVRINIRSDTLTEALTNSSLKNYMPCYLLFAVVLGMEIQTSAHVAN